MQNNEIRNVNLEFRNTNIEERVIEGYASVFSENYTLIKDKWGEQFYERIMQGAFKKTLANEEREHFFLVNHDWDKAVGRSGSNLELNEDEKGLYFRATIPNTTTGNDLLENVKAGIIRGCSFGFKVKDEDVRWDDNWTFYRDIKEVDLFEITATTHPAYADTEISEGRSTLNIKELRETNKKNTYAKKENEKRHNMSTTDMLLCFLSSFNLQNK